MSDTDKAYTRDEVSKAVNAGADLVLMDPDLYISDKMMDAINLVVNAALHVLDNPSATLNDVIVSNYDPELDVDEEPSEDDKSDLIIKTVRGWLD